MQVFFLWHKLRCCDWICCVSFYSVSFLSEYSVYYILCCYQCCSGNTIERHLDLALDNHVRMMVNSLDLSERVDSLNLSVRR